MVGGGWGRAGGGGGDVALDIFSCFKSRSCRHEFDKKLLSEGIGQVGGRGAGGVSVSVHVNVHRKHRKLVDFHPSGSSRKTSG